MADFQNVTITNETVPIEILEKVDAGINGDGFHLRLKTGGTMRLDNSVWKIGDPDFQSNGLVFAALDVLELKNNSKIVTNGNTLILFINKLISENGHVISFEDDKAIAKAGDNGTGEGVAGRPGMPGDFGGLVTIHVIEEIQGILNVNLRGQSGGKGGDGQSGSKGFTGAVGTDGVSGVGGFPPHPTCVADATGGAKGGTGGPGGHGGDGGSGGSGGTLQLFNLGETPLPDASYTFSATKGTGGSGGSGGHGGPGGDGGPGGRGGLFCHGANQGPPGDQGKGGDNGNIGIDAADGQKLVKNLDLELIVRNMASNGGVIEK